MLQCIGQYLFYKIIVGLVFSWDLLTIRETEDVVSPQTLSLTGENCQSSRETALQNESQPEAM